ncbi:hypothetical protein [Streptomyces marincola]|uniref:hypothetical protein n=1 Tax=Streptomyces marincola TaxID=2878388 RepID=UPI001CF5F1B3|nr:hypothetical protein [Streptomyces marincola]UCM88329.1 hypothetical protein LC193_10380 [Streptomyces marincola]
MPHPTPVQIAYGSATVISLTFVSLLLLPAAAGPAVVLIATLALIAGAWVAVAAPGRRQAPEGRAPGAAGPAAGSARPVGTARRPGAHV